MDLEMESKLKRKSRKLGGANGYKKLEKELALLEAIYIFKLIWLVLEVLKNI